MEQYTKVNYSCVRYLESQIFQGYLNKKFKAIFLFKRKAD